MKSDLSWSITTTSFFLFFWLAGPGQAQVVCPDPPNRVTVTVNATVTFDPANQLFTYEYEVFNDPTSLQDVNHFALDFASPVSEITSPQGWSDGFFDGRSTISWYAVEPDPSYPDEPDTGDIPPPLFPIRPGTSMSGFSFKSPNPPGPVKFYVMGFTQLPGAPSELEVEELLEECPQIRGGFFDLAVTGFTQGPVSTDLAITKTDSPDPVTAGSNLTYTITVTNNGPFDATGVTMTDPLPAEVTFVSATPSQGTCSESAGTVTCVLGSLANGTNATVGIVVTPPVPGTITDTATVTGDQSDPNPANNTATETTAVNAP